MGGGPGVFSGHHVWGIYSFWSWLVIIWEGITYQRLPFPAEAYLLNCSWCTVVLAHFVGTRSPSSACYPFFGGRLPLLKYTTEQSWYSYADLSTGGPTYCYTCTFRWNEPGETQKGNRFAVFFLYFLGGVPRKKGQTLSVSLWQPKLDTDYPESNNVGVYL